MLSAKLHRSTHAKSHRNERGTRVATRHCTQCRFLHAAKGDTVCDRIERIWTAHRLAVFCRSPGLFGSWRVSSPSFRTARQRESMAHNHPHASTSGGGLPPPPPCCLHVGERRMQVAYGLAYRLLRDRLVLVASLYLSAPPSLTRTYTRTYSVLSRSCTRGRKHAHTCGGAFCQARRPFLPTHTPNYSLTQDDPTNLDFLVRCLFIYMCVRLSPPCTRVRVCVCLLSYSRKRASECVFA